MNNCETIHETSIKDIVTLASDTSKEVKDMIQRRRGVAGNWKSIAQASSNLTLVFPVLTTRSIEIENATMISKAIERKAVTMLQMLFSAINISDSTDLFDYIKRFHTNINFNDGAIGIDDFIEVMDTIGNDSASASTNESSFIEITDREIYEAAMADLKNLSFFLPDNISENSVNDFKIHSTPYGSNIVLEKKIDFSRFDMLKREKEAEAQRMRDEEKYNRDLSMDNSTLRKGKTDFLKNQILDSDIKKANELIPTMMVVNFHSISTGTPIKFDQGVIGVKAKLYPIDSMDIINRIRIKNEDHNGFTKFIKASTREISFWKDLVFAVDQAKIDAIANTKRGSTSKMWKVLERRALRSKIRRTMGSKANDGAAISTLVVSQEEVEYLKKNDNLNIENPKIIRAIMESYNFMGICIVDEANEVAKFLFDTGNDDYETLSFRNLERESSDGSYKKVINLMTKLSR